MSSPAPGWYPDPSGTAPTQQRWWNGSEWTEQARAGSDVAEPVGLTEAIRRGFLDWSPGRRASRSEFWWLVLFAWLVQIPANVAEGMFGIPGASVASLAGVVILLKTGVRRYRDAGRRGWLFIVHMVAVLIGWITAVIGAVVAGFAAWGNDDEAAGWALWAAGAGLLGALVVGVWALVVLCSKGRPGARGGDGSPLVGAPATDLPVINGE